MNAKTADVQRDGGKQERLWLQDRVSYVRKEPLRSFCARRCGKNCRGRCGNDGRRWSCGRAAFRDARVQEGRDERVTTISLRDLWLF